MDSQPIQCQRCGILNLPNAKNCQQCGNVLRLKNTGLSKSLIIIITIIAIPILCCGLCQLGKNDNSNRVGKIDYMPSPNPFISTTPNAKPSVEANTTTKSSPPVKTKTFKTAVVISENANLRKTPDATGEIIQELAEGSNVEIITRRSVWFQARFNGQTGWIHGNTIRLDDAPTEKSANLISNSSSSKSLPTGDYSRKSSSSSGYYVGPRGGCYTYTSGGRKKYVDHSYCN